MKYSCDEIKENLSYFIDDVLTVEEKKKIEEHIGTCDACAKEYAGLCALISELNALPTEPLPPDFNEKLHKRLVLEGKPIKKSHFAYWQRYSALAAGLLLVFLIRAGYYNNINKMKTAYVDDAILEMSDDVQEEKSSAPPEIDKPDTDNSAIVYQGPNEQKQRADRNLRSNKHIEQITEQQEEKQAENVEPIPQPTQEPQETPEVTPDMKAAQQENETAMFSIRAENEIAPSRGRAEMRNGTFSSASMSSHDTDSPCFVSVTVKVDRFDDVSLKLKEKYNAAEQDEKIILELDNEQFKEIMDLLVDYGATVTQEETDEPLTINKCVVTSK